MVVVVTYRTTSTPASDNQEIYTMAGFLAYIMPVDTGAPTHPIAPGGPPPSVWPDPGHPAHPIVIPPDAISPGVPSHPIYLPPVVWPPGGHPAHPIVIPPGSLGPGKPSHPIVLPPPAHPSHPIVIPPGSIAPGVPAHPIVLPPPGYWGGVAPPLPTHPIAPGGKPPGFWGGESPPSPEHPIELPPGGEPIEPPSELPPPAGHEDDLVVLVYKPGQGWSGAAYDVAPDQGLPQPTPHG
jgi:hypothetical protein